MAGMYIAPVDPARHRSNSNVSLNSCKSVYSAASSGSHNKLDKKDIEYIQAVQTYGVQGKGEPAISTPFADLGGTPQAAAENDTTSLYIVMFYTFMMTVSYIIILPTSKAYVTNLGGNEDVVGLAIGLTPCISGLCQLPIMYILRKVDIRTLLLYFTAWLAAMQVLYAMAGWMDSLTVLLMSRALMGIGDGPQLVTLFVVRSTTPKTRSAVMLMVGVSIAAGYSAGCLLSTMITEAKKGIPIAPAGTALAMANSASIAGWFIVAMAIYEWVMVFKYFVEPAKHVMRSPSLFLSTHRAEVPAMEDNAQESKKHYTVASTSGLDVSAITQPLMEPAEAEPAYPIGQLTLAYAMCFLIPVQISAWEVMIAVEAEDMWGWTPSDTGLYLFFILTIAIPVYKIKLSSIMSDRSGVLSFVLSGILGSLMFLGHSMKPETLGISTFTIGSVVFLISMQIARGFAWALLTNLVPLGQRPILVGINAMLYMLGRGVGAVVPPFIKNLEEYVAVFTGAMSVSWLAFFWAYKSEFFPKKRNMRTDIDIDESGGH